MCDRRGRIGRPTPGRAPCTAVANRLLLILFLRCPGSVRSRQEVPHQSVRAFRALVRLGSIGRSTEPAAIDFLAGAGFFGIGGGRAPQIFVSPCVRDGGGGTAEPLASSARAASGGPFYGPVGWEPGPIDCGATPRWRCLSPGRAGGSMAYFSMSR